MTADRELSTVERAREVIALKAWGVTFAGLDGQRLGQIAFHVAALAEAGLLIPAGGEWKYGIYWPSTSVGDSTAAVATEEAARLIVESHPHARVVRRRPAGPWLPCPDEETPT